LSMKCDFVHRSIETYFVTLLSIYYYFFITCEPSSSASLAL